MDEHAKATQRLGLVAMALAALSAPVLIPDAAAAKSVGGAVGTEAGGSNRNTIIYGTDGRAHRQTIVLGNDGKPQNNRMVVGRDGKYHDTTGANRIVLNGNATQPTNNHTAYRRDEDK